ncbi:MAG TPA: DUF2279 domain-containing protein [Planctomycetota bacterium]|nr:DUF2279 domain-containing protein [Planctomycetota bacterium]
MRTPSVTRGAGRRRRGTALLLAACLLVGCASSSRFDQLPTPSDDVGSAGVGKTGWTKEEKFLAVNAGMALVIAAYGFQFWDYGQTNFQVVDEGWFGQNTSYGGADKLGHAYASYLTTLGLASLYESWGYHRDQADLLGALSSMGAFTMIEVGDAFSKNGWSTQDIIADAAGVLFGYWRRRAPRIGRLLDYRVEYIPTETFINGDHSDIVTDYSGFKYLLALKLDGIEKLQNTPLSWLELQVGYYTRGFATGDQFYYSDKTRHVYFAIGINVSKLFSKAGLRSFGKIFEFYQAPYTYVPFDWELPQ